MPLKHGAQLLNFRYKIGFKSIKIALTNVLRSVVNYSSST